MPSPNSVWCRWRERLENWELQKNKKNWQVTNKFFFLPDSGDIDTEKFDISTQTHIAEILDTHKKYPLIKELKDKRNKFFHICGKQRDFKEKQFKDIGPLTVAGRVL